jgi:hypothetical protein
LSDSLLYRRTFDGTDFGAQQLVHPYSDPYWDTVATGSGTSTYAGMKSNFYAEIPSLTSVFYSNGRMFYTISGQQSIFWRWFTPDSGTIGADKFTVTSSGYNTVGGVMFLSGGYLYYSKTDGNLYRVAWINNAPTGSATVVSGPGLGGVNWKTNMSFLAP